MRHFSIDEHFAGSIPRHFHPLYMSLPWYDEEYFGTDDIPPVCDECNQEIVIYSDPFRSRICRGIIFLNSLKRDGSPHPTTHYKIFAGEDAHQFVPIIWGLLERVSTGIYRLTNAGEMFLAGLAGIPKRAIRYLGETIAFCGGMISIGDIFKDFRLPTLTTDAGSS